MARKVEFTSNNNDDGTCYVGPVEGLEVPQGGLRPVDGSILLQLTTDAQPRKVTYVMGSPAKGFHLAARGQGKFPKGQVSGTIILADAE